MKIWMITTKAEFARHSMERLAEEASSMSIDLEFFRPGELSFIAEKQSLNFYLNFFHAGGAIGQPDAVLIKTGSSTITYHTLAMMRALEAFTNIPVINSSETYRRAGDKFSTYLQLAEMQIATPLTQLISEETSVAQVAETFGFPLVMKEVSSGRGGSVVFVPDHNALDEITKFFFSTRKPGSEVLIQRVCAASVGKDVRVFVIGDQIVGAIERQASGGTRKANVSLGASVREVPISDEIASLTRRTQEACCLEIGGIDLLYGDQGFEVCEVNLAAQFVGLERATGINVARQVLSYCVQRSADGDA